MTYGVMVTVPLPIEQYHAVHAEVESAQGDRPVPGLLVHFARETAGGYQLVEVWGSKQDCERFSEQVVNPIVERLSAGRPPLTEEPVEEEFEVVGLITASAGLPRQRDAQPSERGTQATST